jgi:hypothetical protein
LEPLREVLPLYCVSGNHDVGDLHSIVMIYKRGYEQYWKYDLCDVHSEEQRYNNGECWYQFLEEQQLLLLGIGWNLEKDTTERDAWLDSVLDAYSEYPVLIVTHGYLESDGEPNEIGQVLEKGLVSRHPNIRLLICGHRRGARRHQKVFDDGRVFNAVMVNLQNEGTRSTAGYCMLMTFDPLTRSVSFTSYSPYYDDYDYYPYSKNETFTLENAY